MLLMYRQLGCLVSESSIQVVQFSLAKRGGRGCSTSSLTVASWRHRLRRDATKSGVSRLNNSIILDSAGLSECGTHRGTERCAI